MNTPTKNTPEVETTSHALVVGLDYSGLSDLALERACDWAATHARTHLHVLHAESRPGVGASQANPFGPQGEAQSGQLEQSSRRLRERIELIVRRWCEAHSCQPPFGRLTTHVRFKPAAEAIAQLAADVEAELVIVGTHGHDGARRFFLGSVSERKLRLAPCDVLVVHTPDASIPKIEPPCPRCVETRRATNGRELWCEQHREHHDRRHTYHYSPAPLSHQAGLLIHVE
jgi:nucleotide-binding universal stress UspA family protein